MQEPSAPTGGSPAASSPRPAPALTPGLYERVETVGLLHLIQEARDAGLRVEEPAAVDAADAAHVLTVEVAERLRRVLDQMKDTSDQIDLANRILDLLDAAAPARDSAPASTIMPGPRLLRSIADPLVAAPPHPEIPLRDAALLTNAKHDPSLSSQLLKEIDSADRIDLLCAFVKHSGLRILHASLKRARERGIPIRVLTTTYMGATDATAVQRLAQEYGAQVKVSYTADTTRLHAKAWMFHRRTGFSTAYVGSSNLSSAALVDGLEWNVRLSSTATPRLLEKFDSAFSTYWESDEFVPFDPARDLDLLTSEIARQSVRSAPAPRPREDLAITTAHVDVRPYPHQARMLEHLEAERTLHDRHRNLVVAATGTGKTILAALDYLRLCPPSGPRPTLLFVAHRQEIIEQARRTYRTVLKDDTFGEVLVGGQRPQRWRHVFASIQSLSKARLLDEVDPSAFQVVVVDEFHHASASSYRRVLEHLRPEELLALTATPERADGVSVAAEFFDGRIASELRLWDALEEDLLVPFHYFGVADGTDLTQVRFARGRYDEQQLAQILAHNRDRAARVIEALRTTVTDVAGMRALGFCVSVAHAQFMAEVFTEAGIASVALSGESPQEVRRDALTALRAGDLRCIFAVDLFNEGLDIPQIDTILMLRPTQSATIFLQQLGRGLRRSHGKALLTVLDFIGEQNRSFRFDLKFRALTGTSRRRLEDQVRKGFPFLAPGCEIVLDETAQDIVVQSIRTQMEMTTRELVADVRSHAGVAADGSVGELTLRAYLEEADRTLEDVYGARASTRTYQGSKRSTSWRSVSDWAFGTDLIRLPSAEEERLLQRARAFTAVDDPVRLRLYRDLLLNRVDLAAADAPTKLAAAMLVFSFFPGGFTRPDGEAFTGSDGSTDSVQAREAAVAAGVEHLRSLPAVVGELLQIFEVRAEQMDTVPRALEGRLGAVSPLCTHAAYTREELLAGLGVGTLDAEKPGSIREGVKYVRALNTDILLITLKKSEADFSPSTLYRDYALNQQEMHWESQSLTGADSPTGRRYADGSSTVVLFVRETKTGDIGTEPYTCLGTATCVSATGSKPMQIQWRLDRAMPGDLFLAAKAVA
ncbi:DUF3427 domain-containing protein [Helcobacillus sp. ACRRO]|uniref:DEAD/DEAH box helicase n=1 Tax=Helcobacillus sp. ACRRO TaxID=2918202 RepID=UPI001EF5F948|nr:DEAD/DEAH box helicase [Helcobacillus sp. ACRRO]MCG7427795.1 DUF3427 domain-containing protein [Helcobacillus sp. ACRRO]